MTREYLLLAESGHSDASASVNACLRPKADTRFLKLVDVRSILGVGIDRITCHYRLSDSDIFMMQSAKVRERGNVAVALALSWIGRILL